MSNAQITIAKRLNLPDGTDLDSLTQAILEAVATGKRAVCRITIMISMAKQAHFKSDYQGWLTWAMGTFGLEKRTCDRYSKCGQFLQQHLVPHAALEECDMNKLEALAALPPSMVKSFLDRHDPRDIPRDEFRRLVKQYRNAALGITDGEDPDAKPTRKTPERDDRSPLDKLKDFDALTLKPFEEIQFMIVRAQRTFDAFRAHQLVAELSEEQRRAAGEFLDVAEYATCELRKLINGEPTE